MSQPPDPIEPCAVYRMRQRGWPGPAIAHELHMTLAATAKAEREQTEALDGVDRKLVIK